MPDLSKDHDSSSDLPLGDDFSVTADELVFGLEEARSAEDTEAVPSEDDASDLDTDLADNDLEPDSFDVTDEAVEEDADEAAAGHEDSDAAVEADESADDFSEDVTDEDHDEDGDLDTDGDLDEDADTDLAADVEPAEEDEAPLPLFHLPEQLPTGDDDPVFGELTWADFRASRQNRRHLHRQLILASVVLLILAAVLALVITGANPS